MIRGILLAYISLSLFLSQASLPLFTHICHGMGRTWTAFVKPPKACCGKIKQKNLEHHCQKIESKTVVAIDREPCCEDHVKHVSLSCQFVHQVVKTPSQTNSYPSILPQLLQGFSFATALTFEGIVQDHGPPNQPYGRDLLIALQLFLC